MYVCMLVCYVWHVCSVCYVCNDMVWHGMAWHGTVCVRVCACVLHVYNFKITQRQIVHPSQMILNNLEPSTSNNLGSFRTQQNERLGDGPTAPASSFAGKGRIIPVCEVLFPSGLHKHGCIIFSKNAQSFLTKPVMTF